MVIDELFQEFLSFSLRADAVDVQYNFRALFHGQKNRRSMAPVKIERASSRNFLEIPIPKTLGKIKRNYGDTL